MLNTKSGFSSADHREFMNHISDPTLKENLNFYKGKKNFFKVSEIKSFGMLTKQMSSYDIQFI